jgi:tetratricopeptide (TPR) repeat protein
MIYIAVILLSLYLAFLLGTILQSYRRDRQEKAAAASLEAAVVYATDYIRHSDPERAIALLAPLHDERPYDTTVGLPLAVAACQAGQFDRSTRICRWFLVANPDSPEFLFQLGEARRGAGDLSGAREAYERALAASSQHLPTYIRLSEIYRAQGRTAELEPLRQKALKDLPDTEETRAKLAAAFDQTIS